MWSSGGRPTEIVGTVVVGERHVYAPDIQEVNEYLGPNFSPEDFRIMFWNSPEPNWKYVWTRSARHINCGLAWCLDGSWGGYHELNGNQSCMDIQPIFVVDLTKISFDQIVS